MIKIDITIDPTLGDMEAQLTQHMQALGFSRRMLVPMVAGQEVWTPAPKNLDDRPDGPTVIIPRDSDMTVTIHSEHVGGGGNGQIHTTGSTELNAEPPKDYKVEVKTRQRRSKKNDPVVTKDEAVALMQAAVDPLDSEDEKPVATSGDLNHDDLRAVVGEYTKVHGIAKAQKMIPIILGCAIVEVPLDSIQEAIDKIREEITDVDDIPDFEEAAAPTATEAEVRDALMAYARKYDGDDAKMTNTLADGPKILTEALGPTITAIRLIPKDEVAYGRALNAINNAIANNPFNRDVAL